MSRHYLFPLLCCIIFVVTLLPTSSSQADVPLTSEFGVNSHIASRYNNYDVMNWPADVIAGSGAGWVREDFHWFWIEPEPGVFQWDYYDRMMSLMEARNVNVIGVLGHPPGWGTYNPDDGHSEPSFYAPDPQLFAAFARAVVERYRGRIVHWEIWNEPDNPQFWLPQPDPVAYAQLISVVSAEIQNAAPETNILLGGINPYDDTFLRTIAEMGAWWAFDIINIHPYVDPARPEDSGGIGESAMRNMRAVMNWAGQKPVWVTEFGWSSLPTQRDPLGQTNEEEQANYLVRGALLLRAAGAQNILWYSLKDERHNGYGMLRFATNYDDYSEPRPSFAAFVALNRMLAGTQFEQRMYHYVRLEEEATPVYVLRFRREAEMIDVVWAIEETAIRLPTTAAQAEITNRNGDPWLLEAENGLLELYPGPAPLYVRYLE